MQTHGQAVQTGAAAKKAKGKAQHKGKQKAAEKQKRRAVVSSSDDDDAEEEEEEDGEQEDRVARRARESPRAMTRVRARATARRCPSC